MRLRPLLTHQFAAIHPWPIEPEENTPTTRGNPAIDRLHHHWPTNGSFESYGIEGPTMWLVRHLHSDRRVLRHLLADIPEERGEFRINS